MDLSLHHRIVLPPWFPGQMGVPGSTSDEGLKLTPSGKTIFVDKNHPNASDDNDGFDPRAPMLTLQAGINRARYQVGTTTVDSAKNHEAVVLVSPGHYNEQILFSGYNVHIIGLGSPVPGKDYGVSINYDAAIVAAPAVFAFSGSGIRLSNLHIHCAGAIPALYNAGGDNNLIENCIIECDGVNATYGIQMESMKGSWIKDCIIINPLTAGIWLDGGADRYAIHGGIENCMIHSDIADVVGILIDADMTCYNFRVSRNFIDVEGGGAGAIGIDNNAAGNIFVTENALVMAAAAVPAESASHGMLHNYASINGVVTDPFDDD